MYSILSLSSEILKNSQYVFISDKSFSFDEIYLEISFCFNKSDTFIINCSFVIDEIRLLSKFSGAI